MPESTFDDLPILAELGAALDDAMARELAGTARVTPAPEAPPAESAAGGRGRSRFTNPFRTFTIALLFVGLGTSTAAATLTVLRGSPIPSPKAIDLQPAGTPRDAGKVLDLRAENPGGGAPFALRRSVSETGLTCVTVGQMQDDRFGVAGTDGLFRELPAAVINGCGQTTDTGPAVMGARIFDAPDRADVRTVVYGVADNHLKSVSVEVRGRRQDVDVDDGAFLLALREYPEDSGLGVRLTFDGDRVVDYPLGAGISMYTDPSGPAWRLRTSSTNGWTGTCITVGAARPSQRTPTAEPVCGRSRTVRDGDSEGFAEPYLFQVRTQRPGDEGVVARWPWRWLQAPARTMVIGYADPKKIKAVEILGAGDPLRPKRLRAGEFMAALPAEVAPKALTLRFTSRDGTVADFPGDRPLHTITSRELESR